MTHHSDMLIVGAGILGLSLAYAAARRGLKVNVFERSATPLGASVRNFGQALVTGQPPGPMLELAEQTLGCKVQVVERWQGVYGSRGPGPFSFLRPMPGVSVALMHTGVGMSVGPALAERNVATLLGDR
ncbi:FAD-dependent oxidoreductase [Pseudomonas sp. GGS8]|uniref:FAD-dependent oxidoreductase n=1 Tax=Pseudomonas sp. GGS8 TaxID=2817892 RepID=UPI00209E52A2|nr:FAD-dependent oxidoreductase [Pseudomonas sp. GGS8]